MKKKHFYLIFILIGVGVIYRIIITSGGNYLFNMDNARDFIDVREMVVLQKPRLIGPTSGIEGLYNGPAWYYFLAIPFIVLQGDPYGAVLSMIVLWAIGGFFLMHILNRFGILAIITGGLLWIFSNYLLLATSYSLNPNPVVLLTPLLIFLLVNYLERGTLFYGASLWFLGGLFFNFEMAFGFLIPLVVGSSLIVTKKLSYIMEKQFWFGVCFWGLTLFPQIFFELRHNFFMTKSVLNYLNHDSSVYSLINRINIISRLYYDTLQATLLNWQLLSQIFILSFVICLLFIIRNHKFYIKDKLLAVVFLFLIIPIIIHIFFPINVMPWHLGGTMAAVIIFLGLVIGKLSQRGPIVRLISVVFVLIIPTYILTNLDIDKKLFKKKPSADPSVISNQIKAIDYVYQQAQGKDFKVYVYMPSVIDYSYQYLFWWYGKRQYGYLPQDYAYLPNKPAYISSKEKFASNSKKSGSDLVFLIKEPDSPQLWELWENNFVKLSAVKVSKVGPLDIEIRQGSVDKTNP